MSLMKFTTSITLYNSYFDKNDRLTAKSILSIFQDVASTHAEDIGVGYMSMLQKNLYWVLSRIKFDIIKMPEPNQIVIVETWPHPKGKIDFDRDMRILNTSGDVLITAVSKWCVIDTTTRALMRTENVNYMGECYLDVNYLDRFNKIVLPNQPEINALVHIVNFSDLDHNGHMNNTNYASLIANIMQDKTYSHFEINFTKECLINDEIIVSQMMQDNQNYFIGRVEDKVSFTALLW